MSYETYHAIKQQPNGDFVVTSHCSNVHPIHVHEWTMSYYRTQFPDATNEYRLARFLLENQYSGAVYIPEKWKRLDALTAAYDKEYFTKNGVYPTCPESMTDDAINGLTAFINAQPPAEKKTRFMIFCKAYNEYVSAMTMKSKRFGLCSDRDGAKVFRMTQSDIDKLIKRLPAYMQAETIKIQGGTNHA